MKNEWNWGSAMKRDGTPSVRTVLGSRPAEKWFLWPGKRGWDAFGAHRPRVPPRPQQRLSARMIETEYGLVRRVEFLRPRTVRSPNVSHPSS